MPHDLIIRGIPVRADQIAEARTNYFIAPLPAHPLIGAIDPCHPAVGIELPHRIERIFCDETQPLLALAQRPLAVLLRIDIGDHGHHPFPLIVALIDDGQADQPPEQRPILAPQTILLRLRARPAGEQGKEMLSNGFQIIRQTHMAQ